MLSPRSIIPFYINTCRAELSRPFRKKVHEASRILIFNVVMKTSKKEKK
jgi:hypothetical protein